MTSRRGEKFSGVVFHVVGTTPYISNPYRPGMRRAYSQRYTAMWDTGWEADVRIRYDKDALSRKDVRMILSLAGRPGIGDGRGDGYGAFRIVGAGKCLK